MQYSKRLRVNVSTTSKQVHSYDCTVNIERTYEVGDMVSFTPEEERAEILAETDALVAEMDKRMIELNEGVSP